VFVRRIGQLLPPGEVCNTPIQTAEAGGKFTRRQ
jgi:hypothetical protein